MMKRQNSSGMSFLEMMVSITIFMVIVSSIFTVVYTGRLYWRVGTSQIDVQQEARRALSYMAKELQQTRVAFLEGLPTDDAVHAWATFRIPQDNDGDYTVLDSIGQVDEWSNNIAYCLDTANRRLIRLLSKNQLDNPMSVCLCQDGSQANCTGKVLANNVNSLGFIRRSGAPKLIEISVGTNKNIPGSNELVNFTLKTWIKVKN